MTRKLLALGFIVTVAFVLYAQDNKAVKITGYMIDNACAGGHAKDADFAAKVKKHKTSCALMDSCETSGFAVLAEGKLYKLDEAGNKIAADLLKATDTKSGVQVAVEGTVDGETLHATKITEVKTAAE